MIMCANSFFPDNPADIDQARIVIVPVPYDMTSTWVKGADKAPQAIIEASEHLEGYDIETCTEPWKHGIATDKPIIETSDPESMVNAVENRIKHHLVNNRFSVVIGGEHSVSIGSVRAHSKVYDDLTVLQLDAHADFRDTYHGSRYNHACVMARISEFCKVVQVGIRSMDICEMQGMDKDRLFLAKDCISGIKWIDRVIEKLSDQVYITIDLDVFDPAVMPSTGTPEPGGLFWYDVLALLKAVCEKRNVRGFDVVELCPNPKVKAPDFLAAKLIYQLLALKFISSH